MKQELLSQVESAAEGARLSGVQSMPHFPAPLSDAIGKRMKALVKGGFGCDYYDVESQSSALSAAMGSELAGKRTFLAASVPHSMQDLWLVPLLRLPMVMANVSRTPGAFSVKSDHNGVLALRDSGWLMFFPAGNQEILDSIIQAYRVCEDPKVSLPAVVNIDGIPDFREPVYLPGGKSVGRFLNPVRPKIDARRVSVFAEAPYPENRMQQQKAMRNSVKVMEKVNESWKKMFRQDYGFAEGYMLDDAELIIVMAGFHSATAKAAISRLREKGEKAGLLRLRVFRPFPVDEIRALAGEKKIAVLDQNISLGYSGVMHTEVKAALCRPCSSFISLGKHLTEKDFMEVFGRLKKSEKEERIWL